MEGSKEMFSEQRIWEDNQDPRLLGELIKEYLNNFNLKGNESSESKNSKVQEVREH